MHLWPKNRDQNLLFWPEVLILSQESNHGWRNLDQTLSWQMINLLQIFYKSSPNLLQILCKSCPNLVQWPITENVVWINNIGQLGIIGVMFYGFITTVVTTTIILHLSRLLLSITLCRYVLCLRNQKYPSSRWKSISYINLNLGMRMTSMRERWMAMTLFYCPWNLCLWCTWKAYEWCTRARFYGP